LISWIQRDPDGTLSLADARAGSMKPGSGALTPISADFVRWNATTNSTQQSDSNWHGSVCSGTGESLLRCYGTHEQEEPMAAAKKTKTARGRKQDRARVAGKQDYEVRYESKKTGKSATAVKRAVKKVGNVRKSVEKRLTRKK
jgi:hypothetical protein